MAKNKKWIVVLIFGLVIGIFVTNLWHRMGWNDKKSLLDVMEANDIYYQMMNQQVSSQKEEYAEVSSELSRYEEKGTAYTYYNEKEDMYYITLDVFFSNVEQFRDKSELFLKFDERLQWTTEKATVELWVFENNGYTHKDDLSFINAGFLSAGIDVQDVNEKDFPLHIQVKLVAAWAEEEMPEKITFEYGLW